MTEPLILHIETATDICSVAVSEGEKLLALVESGPERSHATLLNRFIREAVDEAGKSLKQLDAIAVSKGPGSYTGLRIGVSTAKGLAYGLEKPLLSCGTILSMACAAVQDPEVKGLISKYGDQLLICPMLDARRMEVYSAFFSPACEYFREVSADIIDENSYKNLLENHQICFFGNGAAKCREFINDPGAHFIDRLNPSAGAMIFPVLHQFRKSEFEDVAYFEPFYLKDFVATKPRKKIL
ncbi:MAG: tRNA (adenosine(37)-N6)-threonylcarbamoyltransferase complex dimerization subunit type 1 TsaB [Bacteroidetes bacterium]|nr:tRNA (adenosine(37)-N6)-threonylcarbamoyltransferase complex dimerization subunit type 1 TsaB [Bacteroidota bacterium]